MSQQVDKEIVCPHCSAKSLVNMWGSINPAENPELREKIMQQNLFDWCCPECKKHAQVLYPCVYHDTQNDFIIYFIPKSISKEVRDSILSSEHSDLSSFKKRAVFSLNEFIEKILIFESGMDDKAIELMKLALYNIEYSRNEKPIDSIYFYKYDKNILRLEFAIFKKNEEKPIFKYSQISAYNKAIEVLKEYNYQDNNKFDIINHSFANKVASELFIKK